MKTRHRVEVTKERIVDDLRKIGVNKGDQVGVTLSLKSIGYVLGGAEAVIDALLEAVGPDGTIMMNTFTRFYPPSWIDNEYIFDHKSTPANTGLVPETLRKRRNSIRSRHPTYSVTAIGKLAEHLTIGHDENSRPFTPYARLAKVDGKYLCIGIGNRLVAIRHEAQNQAGLFNVVPYFHGVRFRDDEGNVKTYVFKEYGCVKKLPQLVPSLIKSENLTIGKIGMAHSILAPARRLLDAMAEMLKENPTLNLCDDVRCLWCRELERRMNLYEKIENPKYFQKSNLTIKIIALINRFRLKEYSFLCLRNAKIHHARYSWGRLRIIFLFDSAHILNILYLIVRGMTSARR